MDEIVLGLIIVLVGFGGWVLGVVGFFSARRALQEVAALRRHIAGGTEPATVQAGATPVQSPPEVVAGPLPQERAPEALAAAPSRGQRDLETLLTTR